MALRKPATLPTTGPVVIVAHSHYVDEAHLNTISWQAVFVVYDWLDP